MTAVSGSGARATMEDETSSTGVNAQESPSTLTNAKACSGPAVHDLQEAARFRSETLGLKTSQEYGLMWLHLAGG